jgi:hypothetical protein
MSGDKNPARGEIVAAVPLMVRGVSKEHTKGRVRCELMRSSGSKVLVASAPEDRKVGVSGRGTEESVVRSRSRRSGGRKAVEKVGGGVKTLCPEARRKGGLDQKSAHDIVCGPNHALCLAVEGWRRELGYEPMRDRARSPSAGRALVRRREGACGIDGRRAAEGRRRGLGDKPMRDRARIPPAGHHGGI